MMFYRRRASPKHRYDIIEVNYGGGGHRTRLRDQEINCSVYGVPLPPYIKEQGRERRPARRRRARRSPTPTGSRTPSFPSWSRRRGKEEVERRKEKGGRRPLPFPNSDWGKGGRAPPLARLSSSTTWAHEAH